MLVPPSPSAKPVRFGVRFRNKETAAMFKDVRREDRAQRISPDVIAGRLTINKRTWQSW
jgi:hypothetical protein